MMEVGISMGPDVLRAPAGPLPADPADDANLPAELQALKEMAEQRLTEWATTGHSLVSSSLYEAAAFYSTGLDDHHTHDVQLADSSAATTTTSGSACLRVDPDAYFDDAAVRLAPDAESHHPPRQPGAAPQRGRDRPRQRRPRRTSRHPDELLRRPPRREGHGRRRATCPRHRRALARRAPARRLARPAVSRSQARARAR